MRIAAVVILYYPEKDILRNVRSYLSHVDKVYLADNSEKPSVELVAELKRTIPQSEYIHDGANAGIGFRLNQVATLAKAAGFDYLLTMDQDSFFSENNLGDYFLCFESFQDRGQLAMCGVEYEHTNWLSSQCSVENCTQLITSGSILSLAIWESLGGFDENLFIDMVDFEYCYRAILQGYHIVKFRNIGLNHRLGSSEFNVTDKGGRKRPRTLYSPVRLYYMLRNYLYMRQKYGVHFPNEIRQTRQAVFSRIKNNFFLKNDKLRVLKSVIGAITDYKRGKMGKFTG